ncbi:hypothetical protein HDU84_002367 [Entophlyctis sp. JEL0112]|nr:hypothetical protein HDU84_002367 [Entophlyctis sp. JEL0112]
MDEARRKNEADADRAVKAAMEALGLDDDKPPTTEEERQKYLTRQLQLGEQFLNQGPSHFRAAATCLFRALQVYPDPIKLLMAFQETVPPPVLDMVMQMMAQEGPPGTEAGGKRGPGGGREDEKIQEILD